MWLWLWLWPAAAALIGPVAWEPPDAAGATLKRPKKKKKKTPKKPIIFLICGMEITVVLPTS